MISITNVVLLSVLSVLGLLGGICELATRITYGRYLSNEEILNYLTKNKPFDLNPYDTNILSGNHNKRFSGFISKPYSSILSKYYISGRGLVPRWSKYTKHIDKMFMDLLDE